MTLDDALDDPLSEVVDRHDDMGSLAVKLGTLETTIFIELGRFLQSEHVKFDVSHSIHTPTQAGPYRTSKNWDDDAGYALHRAISGLTSYYKDAVKAGHRPAESWLVEN